MTRRFRLNAPLLPVLVGLLFALQIFDPFDGWLILLVALASTWGITYAWARALANGLYITREVRFGWAQVGDILEERFTLSNHSLAPALWVEVRDHTDMPGYEISRATAVGPGGVTRWHTQGVCSQRGLFRHGPTTLRSGDPLGIYSVEIEAQHATTLLVTPPIVPLPHIEVAAGGRAGEGRPRPDAPERTVSTASVRQYAPGDSLRYVHWRTSARKDELYVQLFEGAPSGDWWVVLDLDRAHQAGQRPDSTEEHGVILAASLADRGLRAGKAVGLAVNSHELGWLPPREGDGQRWAILQNLALAVAGERSLGELLTRLKPAFGKRSSLILITANTSGDWLSALLPLVWGGSVPTVLLLEPSSFLTHAAGKTAPVLLPALNTLERMGVRNYVIDRQYLERPEAHPGRQGRRDVRISARGRAIVVHPLPNEAWRRLA